MIVSTYLTAHTFLFVRISIEIFWADGVVVCDEHHNVVMIEITFLWNFLNGNNNYKYQNKIK